MKDYYKILSLKRDATQDAIKKAYRKLAKKYHPDQNPGDKQAEETFKQVNEAYTVLTDETQKAAYDARMFGGGPTSAARENAPESNAGRAYRPRPNMSAADFAGSNNIFEDFFGFNPKSASPDLKTGSDKVKPMKTNEAFEKIFGKRKF